MKRNVFQECLICSCVFRSSWEGVHFRCWRWWGLQGLVVFWCPGPDFQCPAAVWRKPGPWWERGSRERSGQGAGSLWRHPGLQPRSCFRGHAVLSPGAWIGARLQLPLRRYCSRLPQCMPGAPGILQPSPPYPLLARVWLGGQSHPWQHEQRSSSHISRACSSHTSWWPLYTCNGCSQRNLPELSEKVPVKRFIPKWESQAINSYCNQGRCTKINNKTVSLKWSGFIFMLFKVNFYLDVAKYIITKMYCPVLW